MPHSRQDVLRTRQGLATSIDKTQTLLKEHMGHCQGALNPELVTSIERTHALLKEHMGQCHGAYGALENAMRSLSTIAGDEPPLELTETPVKPSFRELAAKLTGNGQ